MKKLKYLLFLLLLIPGLSVKAANLDSLAFLNRTQGNFPFVTDYATSYIDYYNAQYYLFSGTDNLPNYAIITTCATGPLYFHNITPNGGSNLTYMGYVDLGGSCNVNNTYNGQVYVYYFNLISYTDAGNGNMGIDYSVDVTSGTSYNVFVKFTSISFSNSSDFSTILQNQTLIQNQKDLSNKQQETNDKLNNLNDKQNETNDKLTSEDYDVPDFSDLQLADDAPISNLVMFPLNLINKFIDAFNGTCQSYTLPFFDNTNITLPCFNGEKYFGSSLWNTIGMFSSFFMIYEIGMLCVTAFNDFTSMKDTYDSLYTPKHAKPIGKHTSEVE